MAVTEQRGERERSRGSHDRLRRLADLLTAQRDVATAEPDALVRLAASSVPASDRVSFTVVGLEQRPQTIAATDSIAAQLDAIQLELGEGPVIDGDDDVVHIRDLDMDVPWPSFARRAVALGVCSVLTLRMSGESIGRAVLAFYAGRPDAFTDVDVDVARLVGWMLSTALQAGRYRERAANLEVALESNRHIGTAIGVLMARELLTADQAFERLRDASQRLHRKLRELADDVIATGQLPRLD